MMLRLVENFAVTQSFEYIYTDKCGVCKFLLVIHCNYVSNVPGKGITQASLEMQLQLCPEWTRE